MQTGSGNRLKGKQQLRLSTGSRCRYPAGIKLPAHRAGGSRIHGHCERISGTGIAYHPGGKRQSGTGRRLVIGVCRDKEHIGRQAQCSGVGINRGTRGERDQCAAYCPGKRAGCGPYPYLKIGRTAGCVVDTQTRSLPHYGSSHETKHGDR